MADEETRPVQRQSNMPWLFMLIMLPLFFLFGWVANEAYEANSTNGLELGIGGSPEETTQQDIITPTPNTMMDEESPTPTEELTPTPTVTPEEEEENALDI